MAVAVGGSSSSSSLLVVVRSSSKGSRLRPSLEIMYFVMSVLMICLALKCNGYSYLYSFC